MSLENASVVSIRVIAAVTTACSAWQDLARSTKARIYESTQISVFFILSGCSPVCHAKHVVTFLPTQIIHVKYFVKKIDMGLMLVLTLIVSIGLLNE